jgi:uncharacterized protein (DUF1015 family)
MDPILFPTATRLVRPQWSTRVVSPAYDVLRPRDRQELMDRDPYMFLHVTRSPGDDGGQLSDADVGAENAAALHRLIAADLFTQVRGPALYLYRLAFGGHVQTAVVGDVALSGWADGRIRPHERTREHRTAQMADHLQQLGVSSSPVALGYRDRSGVDAIVDQVTDGEPLLDFERGDDLEQTIWEVPAPLTSDLVEAFDEIVTYVVDGHHRLSAALEVWTRLGAGEAGSRLLCAMFPVSQLQVRSFHRRVTDLNGLDTDQLLAAIESRGFEVDPVAEGAEPAPSTPGRFGMYIDKEWFSLECQSAHPSEVDTAVLQRQILGPVLGVDEAARDGRLEYLPGVAGLAHLVDTTDGSGGVAFALHPIPMSQLMAVADAGRTLPPKSTYFEPKTRSGIFVSPR